MSRTVTFFVAGIPATAGSKRGFPIRRKDGSIGVAMAPDNKRTKGWMEAVASAGLTDTYFGDAVMLDVELIFPRPQSHFGSGRNSHMLKPSAPAFHTTKPDSLKCARAIEDALKGVLWRDDSQVARHRISKRYAAAGEGAGAHITVQELAHGDPATVASVAIVRIRELPEGQGALELEDVA